MSRSRAFFTFLSVVVLFASHALAQPPTSPHQAIVVKPGDTLWSLANRYNTTVEAILTTNGLTGSDLIPGATLRLPPGANAEPTTYTVQKGDTLYDIAVGFGVSVDDLIALNNLDGSSLQIGQVLSIRPTAETPAPEALKVVVAPGDTLWALAKRFEVSVEAISTANSLGGSSVLEVGDTLTIPGRYAGTGADQGGAAAPTVTVARGDSLWNIAKRYNTTITAIMSVNGLTDTNLRVGQQLRILPSSELLPAAAPQAAPRILPGMVWPLQGLITSRFGYRRLRINGSNNHTGLDIDGSTGDVVVAASAGVVTFSGWHGGYGNTVVIEQDNTTYYYAHASDLLVGEGEVVTAGQPIATVGNTGASTGSHLHFEIRIDGVPVDPLVMLEQHASAP